MNKLDVLGMLDGRRKVFVARGDDQNFYAVIPLKGSSKIPLGELWKMLLKKLRTGRESGE